MWDSLLDAQAGPELGRLERYLALLTRSLPGSVKSRAPDPPPPIRLSPCISRVDSGIQDYVNFLIGEIVPGKQIS